MGSSGLHTSQTDVEQADLFVFSLENVYNGPFMRNALSDIGEDGFAACAGNSSELMKNALNAWNINAIDFACDSGIYIRSDGTDCKQGTGDFKFSTSSDDKGERQTLFQTYLKNAVFGGTTPTLSPGDLYTFRFNSFLNGCAPGQTIHTTKPGGDRVYELRVFPSSSLSGSTAWVIGVKTSTDSIPYTTNPNADINCGRLAELSRSAAIDYGRAEACSIKYSNTSEWSACVDGAENASSLSYCSSAYPNFRAGGADAGGTVDRSNLRKACYVGQGNQGAEECKGYSGNLSLWAACISGAQNASNAAYCSATYPPNDAISPTNPNPSDPNREKREACNDGQKLSSGSGLSSDGIAGAEDENAGGAGDAPTTCAVDGIGWLVCPVISFLATIADNAFEFLSDSFLRVDLGVYSTTSGTFQAWSIMRGFANVAFVIVFLFIIFSQLTGAGVSNYGIKKMLPRLIIAAILVNISFYICQLAVDLSNILGTSIKSVFDAIGGGISGAEYNPSNDSGNWVGIAATVLALGAGAWALGMAVLLPVLVGAVIALVMIFLILITRQMLIVLLIAIAPLAFVAYLLPNTEQWFDKWRKVFFALLLLFPIVGVLFGAAGLASTILKEVYEDSGDIVGQIVAAGVLVLPLFLLPSLLKGSLKATGQLGAKLSGYADSFSKGAKSKTANTGLVKNYAANKAQRKAAISTGTYRGRNVSGARSWLNRQLNNSGTFNTATGGYGAARTIAGQGQERKDAQEAMAMFGGDDTLVAAWAASGGDETKIPKEFKLNKAQLEQYNLLRNAGHSKKSTSFTAAAQYLSENGKGNSEAFASALGTAAKLGASETDISNAWETGVAAYRKSGRGDAVGELKAYKKANNDIPMIDGAAREALRTTVAGDQAIATARAKAWQEVGASSVHREGITPQFDANNNFDVAKSGGYISYQQHLVSEAENTRAALAGFDSMEARAKAIAQEPILKAARHHQEDATGTPSTIKSIQEAKTYFNIK